MSDRCLMGVDKGTSVTKVAIFDLEGQELGVSQYPTELLSPHPGWAEEDPDASWEALKRAVPQALKNAGVTKGDVAAIGCTGTMAGAWLLDESGRELRNGIVWTDQRAASLLSE